MTHRAPVSFLFCYYFQFLAVNMNLTFFSSAAEEQPGFFCKMSPQYLTVWSQTIKYMTYVCKCHKITDFLPSSHVTDHKGMWGQEAWPRLSGVCLKVGSSCWLTDIRKSGLSPPARRSTGPGPGQTPPPGLTGST